MKKTLLLILAVALLCMAAVGGTLSYFTDTDADINTMVVGNVKIEQLEQYHKDGALADWHPNGGADYKPGLYPYIGDAQKTDGWYDTAKNAIDKIVSVKNTGSETAYVRTVFAFEMKKIVTENADGTTTVTWEDPVNSDLMLNVSGDKSLIGQDPVIIYKDATGKFSHTETGAEVAYVVGVYTYEQELAKDQTTEPSLLQIYLHKNVDNKFYDTVGGSYDILVLSQAVQKHGFGNAETALNTAFCEISAENAATIAGWFNEVN